MSLVLEGSGEVAPLAIHTALSCPPQPLWSAFALHSPARSERQTASQGELLQVRFKRTLVGKRSTSRQPFLELRHYCVPLTVPHIPALFSSTNLAATGEVTGSPVDWQPRGTVMKIWLNREFHKYMAPLLGLNNSWQSSVYGTPASGRSLELKD